MKLGIGSYTYGWAVGVRGQMPERPLDELGLLEKARGFGLSLVQIGDNLPLHKFDEQRLRRFAERASEDQLQVEVGARRLTPERIESYVRVAKQLEAKLIRFVIDDSDYHPTREEIIRVLRDAVPLLKNSRLGIENHDRFKAAELREILETVGSDRIGICLDTSNSLGAGEGIEAVSEILAPFTINLHIKDFSIERVPYLMGFHVTGRPAGKGMLDIPKLLQRIEAAGRCETAILELWTPPEATLDATITKEDEWARASVNYLKKHIS